MWVWKGTTCPQFLSLGNGGKNKPPTIGSPQVSLELLQAHLMDLGLTWSRAWGGFAPAKAHFHTFSEFD